MAWPSRNENAAAIVFEKSGMAGPTLVHLARTQQWNDLAAAVSLDATAVNMTDHTGNAPLHYAALHHPSALALLAAGANPNARNCFGVPPFFDVAWRGELATLEAMVAYGADVNIRDTEGCGALTSLVMHSVDLEAAEGLAAFLLKQV
jgi:hypothetical protein